MKDCSSRHILFLRKYFRSYIGVVTLKNNEKINFKKNITREKYGNQEKYTYLHQSVIHHKFLLKTQSCFREQDNWNKFLWF